MVKGVYKVTLEEKKSFAKSLGYILKENENFGVDDKVLLIHPDGYSFYAKWYHFKTGAIRGDGRHKPNRRVPYKEVKQIFENYGYTLLTEEDGYRGVHSYVDTISPSGFLYRCTPNKFQQGRRCRKERKSSFGERLVYFILKELLKEEYSFKEEYAVTINGKLRLFDFAILAPNGDVVYTIEYQGEQHFVPVKLWGGESGLKVRQQRDEEKKDYCLANNIPLIEISYHLSSQDVLQLMRDNLNQLLTDKEINFWSIPDTKGRPFSKKDVVDYYKLNTIRDTMVKFNIGYNTVLRYARQLGFSKAGN